MLTPEQKSTVASALNVQRIILLALIAGPASFLIFVIVFRQAPDPQVIARTNIGLLAAGAAAVQFVIALAMSPLMAAQQRRGMASPQARQAVESGAADPVRWLLAGLQTRSIVRAALLEGAAIFNVFAYMTERQPYSIAIAVALLVCIAATLPFRRSTEEWIERELRMLRDEAQFAR